MTPEAREAMIISMVENLQNRLDSEPDDTDGWLRLARAYDVLGNQDAAFTALAAAAASAPEDLPLHYRLLERTIGTSLSDAQFALANAALDRIQKRAADGPQYLFFKGHLAQLSGDNAAARAAWTRLLNTMPKDSEMANALAAEIGKLD
jgi:cytochrome c-type biogenesis protein CcmH